jgi:hypothetical protein
LVEPTIPETLNTPVVGAQVAVRQRSWAGLSPLEIANEVTGSIRIAAHFCGVFGLKTTEHRVSMAGERIDLFLWALTI